MTLVFQYIWDAGQAVRAPWYRPWVVLEFSLAKYLLILSLEPTLDQRFILSIKYFIFSCNHCSSTTFILYTQVILIKILIDVQYFQNLVFRFKTCLNCQNHSLLDSHHLVKNIFPQENFPFPPTPTPAIWKIQNFLLGLERKYPKTMAVLGFLIKYQNG